MRLWRCAKQIVEEPLQEFGVGILAELSSAEAIDLVASKAKPPILRDHGLVPPRISPTISMGVVMLPVDLKDDPSPVGQEQ